MSRSRKIPVSVALRRIRKFRPTNPSEFRKIGLTVRWLKSGVFRETCRILNCDLVVKFPLAQGRSKYTGEGRRHTKQELRRLARLKKFRFMHQFLPKVYYHDPKSGTLVMSYHPPFGDHEEQADAMGHMVQVLIHRATGVRTTDMHSENVHQQKPKRKRAVVIDLGY